MSNKEEIDKLNKVFENHDVGAALPVEDVTEVAMKYLNDDVKEALKNKVTNTIELNPDMSVKYKVTYFGTKVSIPEVGIKKVCQKLNDISKHHKILGFLGGIIEFPLAKINEGKDPDSLILAYIAVSADSYCVLVEDEMSFNKGGQPEKYLETSEDIEEL